MTKYLPDELVQPPAPSPIKLELPLPYLDFVVPLEVAPQVSSQSQGSPLRLHPCLYCTRIQDGFTVPPSPQETGLGEAQAVGSFASKGSQEL